MNPDPIPSPPGSRRGAEIAAVPVPPSDSRAAPRRWLCIAAALALASQATWLAIDQFRNLRRSALDPYSLNSVVAKFAPLRPHLAGLDRVGYLASRPMEASAQDELVHSVARYVLAPTLVCGHAKRPFVITNFDTNGELDVLLKRGEFTSVARVGPGRALLQRVPARGELGTGYRD